MVRMDFVHQVTWFARSSVDTELALHRAGAADLARRLKLRLRPGEAMPGWKADLSSQMLALVTLREKRKNTWRGTRLF